jgi:chromatin modification-related protein VID21
MLSRKKPRGVSFPDVDEDEKGIEESWPEFGIWREDYRLQAGLVASCLVQQRAKPSSPSRIPQIRLPNLPMLSPPVSATVFPDEIHPEQLAPIAGPSRPRRTGRPSTPPRSPPQIREPSPLLFTSDSTQPEEIPRTIALEHIAPPRIRRLPSRFSPPPESSHIPWEPINNYNPTQNPAPTSTPLPMSLEWSETSKYPRLPALPPTQPKKSRRTKPEDRKPDLHKLQISYTLNPLSSSISKSSKCVLTNDWRVAQQELRHIRAMEKIEAKKRDGRWSLRQPKKLRGPGVPKSHWDYLLEEMVSVFVGVELMGRNG